MTEYQEITTEEGDMITAAASISNPELVNMGLYGCGVFTDLELNQDELKKLIKTLNTFVKKD